MSDDRTESRCSVPEGRYANFFRVGFNAQEFVFDFGQLRHGNDDEEEWYHSRIIVVPVNTKRFFTLLQESIESYEDTFAVIPDPDD